MLFEVTIPQRGRKRALTVYVGEDFGVVGRLFGPDNSNLSGRARQEWRAEQVAWSDLIEGREPVYGSAEAPVRIAMFTDPDCPACQQAKGRLDKLAEEYGDALAVYLLWLPLDMHEHARPKAKVLSCFPAERQKTLFDRLKPMEPDDVADVYAGLEDKGAEVPQSVRACVDSGEAKAALDRNQGYANDMGVRSVPSVYFDDRLYKGFPESAIRSGLEAAR
jgi:protein-disulfide isomerase